jgi:hypothetical protein
LIVGADEKAVISKSVAKQTKKQLLKVIRKETKAPKGFGQWVIVLERRRLSEKLGLLRLEAELDGKSEWSGSMSVALPEAKKFGPDGKELPGEWDNIAPGESGFNIFTLELRGKTLLESAKGWIKRSFENGKIQDVIPFVKG